MDEDELDDDEVTLEALDIIMHACRLRQFAIALLIQDFFFLSFFLLEAAKKRKKNITSKIDKYSFPP